MKSYAHSLSTWKNVALIGIFTFLLAACGDDSKTAGGTEEDSAITAIKDKTVSGVSQKGPFVKGASVTVYELDGKSLSQTGRSYEGKIKNERGEFSVDVVKLESQYALLKADGYYRNEITGEKSNSTVTLYAMTDLSDRNEVNVNLLTHLEYERSRYLVKQEKLSVSKAKLQAESEVLKSFGIEDEFENSENLNIFGEDDGSAALLAISVLMQGDLKEADFTERLTEYADDIEEDGVWDDMKTATKIADWAAEKSLDGGLATIRSNIAGWELSADVPAYEKYVDNYWWQNYGLGDCEKKRDGEVLQNTNALSNAYGTFFICSNNAWRLATILEYDTYQQKCDEDGKIVFGNVNEDQPYDCDGKSWRTATEVEGVLGGCIEKRFDEVSAALESHYICQKREWREATDIEKDTYKWDEFSKNAKDGDVKYGDVIKTNCYVYENGVWRSGKVADCLLGLRGCTESKQGVVEQGNDNFWYIGDSKTWRNAMNIEKDTYKQECTEFGQIVYGNVNKEKAYFCYGTEWKPFYGNESVMYGKLEDKRDGKIYRTVKIGTQTWMAENLNYVDSAYPSIGPKWCEADKDSCAMFGLYYSYSWPSICPDGWHLPSLDEWNMLYDSVEHNHNALQAKGFGLWKNATDDFGLSVFPVGLYCEDYHGKDYYGVGANALFEIASKTDFWSLSTSGAGFLDQEDFCDEKGKSYSTVRCLQDDDVYAEVIVGSMTDARDGQTYKTVSINGQTWLAENLNYKVDSSFCINRQESNCSRYGRLYTWVAAVSNLQSECDAGDTCSMFSDNVQGVCPSGWHLPSKVEWETLMSAAGGQAGKILKSTSGWNHRGNGTDAFSFSALPAGYWFDGYGDGEGSSANFWSSTEYNSESVYYMSLDYRMDTVILRRGSKYDEYSFGFSVRCVKD